MALINCPNCEKEVSDEALCCLGCGYPIHSEIHAEPSPEKIAASKSKGKKLGVLLVLVLMVLAGIWANQNVLLGDDKAAYDIMVACADNFKDPASLRLVSGTLGVDKDCLFVRVRAKNGFGAYNTADYFFSAGGWALEEDETSSLYDAKDFNCEKINRIYARRYN